MDLEDSVLRAEQPEQQRVVEKRGNCGKGDRQRGAELGLFDATSERPGSEGQRKRQRQYAKRGYAQRRESQADVVAMNAPDPRIDIAVFCGERSARQGHGRQHQEREWQ